MFYRHANLQKLNKERILAQIASSVRRTATFQNILSIKSLSIKKFYKGCGFRFQRDRHSFRIKTI
jgi:hypothetical protein